MPRTTKTIKQYFGTIRLGGALESEATNVNRNRLRNIAIKINKVLCTPVKLNNPVLALVNLYHIVLASRIVTILCMTYQLALGAVRELSELRRSRNEASLTDRRAAEKVDNGARHVVGRDGSV